nr:hypothetical protein [Tanacetum cinerariifolium]
MVVFDLNQPTSSLSEENYLAASNSHVVFVSSLINTRCDSFASHDDYASSVIHHEFIDTLDGSIYWVLRVSASVLPVLGTVYGSLDECIEIYRKYALEASFGIILSCQKRLNCGYVKHKYIVCNREWCLKDVWLNTLDPKKNDRQVRSSNFRVSGCKARVVFDMVVDTTKYILTTFDVEHIHELDKFERFVITCACTQTEFKNFTRGVNCFIGDSDAQMLITRIEQRQEFTKDFSFDYFVEDAELCASNSSKTPKAVIHHEFINTPDGSVYWVPKVSTSVLPVLGTVYDSLDECIEIYRKYALEARFDLKNNDRQVRSSNFKVCGCKARVVFDMVVDTTKYILTTFDVEHNHELDRVEYKHLFKAKRKLTYNEQLFIIKAANANIVSNFVQEFMGVKKPDKVKVKNPTVVVPSGGDHVDGGLRDGASGSVSV